MIIANLQNRRQRRGCAIFLFRAGLVMAWGQCMLLLLLLLVGHYEVESKTPTKKVVVTARKEDVRYIKCGVCEEIAKQLHRQVKNKKAKLAPKKITELEIIDVTENVCNLKKEEAEWLMYLDIVEDGTRLKLVVQQSEGECNTECKTIERACQEVMGDYDTDVAEFLYKGEAQRSALSTLLCKDLSKACVGKLPAVPKLDSARLPKGGTLILAEVTKGKDIKDREPGPPFTPKPSKDAEMARIMRSMSDMPGAPGMQMYSRDEFQNGGFGLGDEGNEDEDDNDQEEMLVTPMGSKSGFLYQAQFFLGKLKSGVQNAVDSAVHHVREVSLHFKKWWDPKSSSSRKLSKSSAKVKYQKATKSEL